ncbi:hypothetical protein FPAPBKPN_00028 [Klebsiella phage vB_KpnP_2146-HW]|uniref:Uncharacterized protein n=1 Tax=Klebsiella phage vB_KpnP_2146-HW TaxID=3038211 RepID=A0A9Y2E0U6_9CAUD|nr:hypothetical protein FPAPBKPN_00028 [Klebsiella phage vB_KpnP_2146-HW]
MKDFLGNTIEIGDTIVYADAGGRGGSSSLNKTVVTKMTDKQVMVYESSWSKLWRPFNRVVVVAKGGA